ncbi:MAG TPA: cyanophycin synthetase [Polyangiaceae bacterium]|nr:cyanophycin synthetase [Polyangiaceae bacterium]
MDIQQILVLRGPNVWANFPVLEVWVRLSKELDVPSNTFPGFNDRLMSWLPSMIEHRCGIGERGGFFQRLRTGTYLGHILEHTSLEIQSLVGPVVGFGRARESIIPGLYRVAIEYADERLGLACVQTAIALLNAARLGTPFSIEEELGRLRALADQVCLGPSTNAIVSAAKARKIPHIRLNEGNLVQLGYASAQHRIWTAETERTCAVAESIAQDKQLTRSMLRNVGVPVPEGRVVTTAEEAWQAAEALGLPVVVKPREGHWGRGVSIDLSSRDAVLKAFDLANAEREGVLVEQCIPGVHHRVLVVGGRVVAAAKGEPDQVTGDGVHTLKELVEKANSDPRRGDPQTHELTGLEVDTIALQLLTKQGYTIASIPAAGAKVILHHNGDLPTDITEQVHPSVAAAAVLAAKTVGLNIAGIDIVAEDLTRPLEEQRGAVLEVNASPSLLMHLRPLQGQPQPVGAAIVDEIFGVATASSDGTGRIPIVAVSGTNGKSSVVALLQAAFEGNAKRLGVACSEGLFVGDRAIETSSGRVDATDFDSIERLLVNPSVDVILAEMNPRTVLTQGIAFDQCEVAVVINVGSSDHLGYTAMDRDRMLLVERCGVDMVLPTGTAVLNADDSNVLEMVPKCKGSILLFGRDHNAPALAAHRAESGRTVGMRNGRVVFSLGEQCVHEAKQEQALFEFEQENLLAALGAGWALGLEPATLVERLARVAERPRVQRIRWHERDGRFMAVSCCHNLSAFEAVLQAVFTRPNSGRRIALCSALPADWRVEDAAAAGKLLGAAFDRVELLTTSDAPVSRPEPGSGPDVPSKEQIAAVKASFSEGVAGAARAAFAHTNGLLEMRVDCLLRELERGDLLFVQVETLLASMEGRGAPASGGEDLRIQGGSSSVTAAADLTRPLV